MDAFLNRTAKPNQSAAAIPASLPSAGIRMWSDESAVHIEWDNREKLLGGGPAWTATLGSYHLPRAGFIGEVRSFQDRLMEQMGERVAQVLTAAQPEVAIDLCQHHQQRRAPIDRLLAGPAIRTDWEQVSKAIGRVESGEFLGIMAKAPAKARPKRLV